MGAFKCAWGRASVRAFLALALELNQNPKCKVERASACYNILAYLILLCYICWATAQRNLANAAHKDTLRLLDEKKPSIYSAKSRYCSRWPAECTRCIKTYFTSSCWSSLWTMPSVHASQIVQTGQFNCTDLAQRRVIWFWTYTNNERIWPLLSGVKHYFGSASFLHRNLPPPPTFTHITPPSWIATLSLSVGLPFP